MRAVFATTLPCSLAFALLTLLLPGQDRAVESHGTRPMERRFTFIEETLHGGPEGHFEYEQWVTFGTHTENDSGYKRFDFKHELEYAVSDEVHVAIDFADWHYEDSDANKGSKYDATGLELKVRWLDPRTDFVGLGIKSELEFGSKELEWKNTLMVDKTVDRWHFAYNFLLVAGWEGEKSFEFEEGEGEIEQSIGASLQLQPSTFIGTEFVWQIPLPEWTTGADQNVYLGPNISYHGDEWALTATPLFLLTGADDEPEFQLRLLFEIDF